MGLEGVNCSACVHKASKVLDRLPGVQSRHVSLENKEAVLMFAASVSKDDATSAAVAALNNAKFHATPQGTEHAVRSLKEGALDTAEGAVQRGVSIGPVRSGESC